MFKFMTRTLLAATLIGATPGAPAAAPRQYPLKDFFRNPDRGYFRLSDDGSMIAFMRPVSVEGQPPRMNIFVQSLQGATPVGEPRKITSETARDIGSYVWKGSDTILYAKDFGGDENFHVLAVNVHDGKVVDLTPFEQVRAGIADDLEDDPEHILINHNQRDPQVFDVYRVNVHTGASVRVAQNPGNVVGWQTDHAGKVRAAITSDGLNTTLLYRDDEEQPFRPLITTDYRTTVSPVLFTFDDKQLYALSNRGRDTLALVRIDPAQPDAEEMLFDPRKADLGGIGYSRRRKVLTVATYETDKPQRKFFDMQIEAIYRKLGDRLQGYEFALQGETRAEDKFIVAAYNDRTPGSRYVYDVKSDTLVKLADINPALPEADMAPVQPITYQSRDGLTLHGYLTLPVGREPRGLPIIVNPHGGPWARDSWGYNAEAQFLANRGFGVLQINFRGSTGYGRKFWEASFGQWGLAMQDDITDGVQWLISQGIADPKRIGIYGGSYGGYATLAGITFTPDLYAAAVDYVGVSNLFTFMNTIPPYWKPLLAKMYDMVGNPEKDKERLQATSPALHVDRIKTPLFIAQGAKDPRVNKAESDQVVEALRARGVEVEYMVKENEGHGFHNDENKFEFYEAMEKFFVQHLKP
ncbi:S9 family peptidase [Bordetella genomosp. 8]|uniref:S9 family peptidase n=2 Tax=Bordetella genomosp. 8 TaxID=1416806 RepID=A0A1W6YJ80_9BORD|nr:S9 family peptidase [Bordetella genomosp. 8]ARP81156.1 S9 family peptidase [Bordetella genomosp. 8]